MSFSLQPFQVVFGLNLYHFVKDSNDQYRPFTCAVRSLVFLMLNKSPLIQMTLLFIDLFHEFLFSQILIN